MPENKNRPSDLPEIPKDNNENQQFKNTGVPIPDPPNLQPNMLDLRNVKSARTLIMVANIAGPVSLFIGGVLLGTAGLVCGIIGYRKLSALLKKKSEVADIAIRLRRSSIVAMVICSVAIILNAIAIYLMLPVVLEMLETGNYTGLVPNAGTGTGGSSTWG